MEEALLSPSPASTTEVQMMEALCEAAAGASAAGEGAAAEGPGAADVQSADRDAAAPGAAAPAAEGAADVQSADRDAAAAPGAAAPAAEGAADDQSADRDAAAPGAAAANSPSTESHESKNTATAAASVKCETCSSTLDSTGKCCHCQATKWLKNKTWRFMHPEHFDPLANVRSCVNCHTACLNISKVCSSSRCSGIICSTCSVKGEDQRELCSHCIFEVHGPPTCDHATCEKCRFHADVAQVEVLVSNIPDSGRGLFCNAKAGFKANTKIAEFTGSVVAKTDFERASSHPHQQHIELTFQAIELKGGRILIADEPECPARYANCSKSKNQRKSGIRKNNCKLVTTATGAFLTTDSKPVPFAAELYMNYGPEYWKHHDKDA